MIKKSFITILVFSIIAIITYPVFATNVTSDAENTLNGIKEGVQNMISDTGNSVERAKNGIGNALNDGKDYIENGARDLGNGTENVVNDMERDTNMEGMTGGTNGDGRATGTGYNVARTSASDIINTSNTTIWTVLAIVGIVIVALVWYYGSQVQNNNRDNY